MLQRKNSFDLSRESDSKAYETLEMLFFGFRFPVLQPCIESLQHVLSRCVLLLHVRVHTHSLAGKIMSLHNHHTSIIFRKYCTHQNIWPG